MPARVIVIGLDAAESTLIERWAAEGSLPFFADLSKTAAACRLTNSVRTLPSAIWTELTTGRLGCKLGLYHHPRQLRTGEARLRPILPEDIDAGGFFWTVASRAGRRVAAVDMPEMIPAEGFNGIQLCEWGGHDRTFPVAGDPPGLLDELRAKYGDHPVETCDRHGATRRGYERLLDDLLDGVSRKTALLLDLLGREHWDLFTCGYGETHCVGHQYWHFHDPRHPRHDPAAPERLRGAVQAVYRRVAEGVAAVVEAAGADATVLVVASHGMGVYGGGWQLLPEILARLGMASGGEAAAAKGYRRLQDSHSSLLKAVKFVLRPVIGRRIIRKLQTTAGSLHEPLESPQTRAAVLQNNACGAIRINLKGREPFGSVEPGPEADALTAELKSELLALEDPETGEPIVERVVTPEEAFGADHHPDLPDLLVGFRTDLGPIESCRSDRVGQVHVPIYSASLPRTGDHTAESRLWIKGPGVPAGERLADANVLDVAPTVLRLLDVPLPDTLDGRPLPI